MFYCDAHIHLLPHMDNGPRTIDESLSMLEILQRVRTRKLILTSHFDMRSETCAHFISRRKESFTKLRNQAGPLIRHMKMLLSAEVYLTQGVSRLPLLERLCISHTRCLPLELPLAGFDRHMMAEFAHLLHKRKIIPIISATERYFLMYSQRDYETLSGLPNVVYQFTANALQNKDILYEAIRLLHTGHSVILGSNAHGYDHRMPVDEKTEEFITKSCGASVFQAFSLKTASYFKDAFSC
ncbi:MAG: hypothetical protein IJ009_07790 [Clostridia bacterium]|nr:hypothetical protein [Clostridia bacterium]